MQVSLDEINSFHEFAVRRIKESGQHPLTMDDLLFEWDSFTNRSAINKAISEGLADIEEGRTRPATEVLSDLKTRHGLD